MWILSAVKTHKEGEFVLHALNQRKKRKKKKKNQDILRCQSIQLWNVFSKDRVLIFLVTGSQNWSGLRIIFILFYLLLHCLKLIEMVLKLTYSFVLCEYTCTHAEFFLLTELGSEAQKTLWACVGGRCNLSHRHRGYCEGMLDIDFVCRNYYASVDVKAKANISIYL